MLLDEAHKNFLNYLEVIKNKSKNTIIQYDRHLSQFSLYLKTLDIEKTDFILENLSIELIEWFRIYLHKKRLKISIKTANAYMISIRSFLRYLEKKWLKSISPSSIELIQSESRHVEFLTKEELERLFAIVNIKNIIWKRDIAIMECIYSTWLRISELTKLNKTDIDLNRKEFAVRWKWKKIRVVYLTDSSAKLIQNYIDNRNDSIWALFIRHNIKKENIKEYNDENLRLSRFFITNMIKKYAIKAWIFKNISAHTLRHSFATSLLSNWADLRIIQEMLWHSNITSTQIYTHITNPQLKDAHKKYLK